MNLCCVYGLGEAWGAPSDRYRACLKGAQRLVTLEVFTGVKICRYFFARQCQGIHLNVGNPLPCGIRDPGCITFTKKKASEALLPLLTCQWLFGLQCSNAFWACYLDFRGPVLITFEYHFQVVFHWERVRSYRTKKGTCVRIRESERP